MTTSEIGVIVAVAAQVVYGFRWLMGLEGRISTHERTCDERMRRLDERHAAILQALHDIRERL